MGHAVLFWVMFYNFYKKSYNESHNKTQSNGYASCVSNSKAVYTEISCHENSMKTKQNGTTTTEEVIKNGKSD